MKKLQDWIVENWLLLLIIACLAAYLLYKGVSGPDASVYDRMKLINDSIIEVNAEIQVERDSIHGLFQDDSVQVEVTQAAVDSLEKLKTPTKIEYDEAHSSIYNTTDSGFVGYLSERTIPAGYMER